MVQDSTAKFNVRWQEERTEKELYKHLLKPLILKKKSDLVEKYNDILKIKEPVVKKEKIKEDDLEKMNRKQLIDLADSIGVENPNKYMKKDLLRLLKIVFPNKMQ